MPLLLDLHNEKWDRRFLELAKYWSTLSKDPSTKVGAVLVKGRHPVGMGYNGFPPGVKDDPERYLDRELKYKLVVHAEVNACIDAGKDARGATLYIYPAFMLPPICNECCKVVIASGVREIVGYFPDPDDELNKRWAESITISRMMCEEAGVEWRAISD